MDGVVFSGLVGSSTRELRRNERAHRRRNNRWSSRSMRFFSSVFAWFRNEKLFGQIGIVVAQFDALACRSFQTNTFAIIIIVIVFIIFIIDIFIDIIRHCLFIVFLVIVTAIISLQKVHR